MEEFFDDKHKKIGSRSLGVSGPVTCGFKIDIKPVFNEQIAIAEVLKSMDEEIEVLEIERNKMIQIRAGAMDDLLTGRVRLTVQEV